MAAWISLDLPALIAAYGALGVGVVVALESMGLPLPGETALVSAAIYAGSTQRIGILAVLASAAAGAILGDNLGYWIGRYGGYPLVRRFGARLGLSEQRLARGQRLFERHGGKIVLFGRFIALLRALAAFLAGVNVMAWNRFFFFNAAGAVLWVGMYGSAAYVFGRQIDRLRGPFELAFLAAAVVGAGAVMLIVHRRVRRLGEDGSVNE